MKMQRNAPAERVLQGAAPMAIPMTPLPRQVTRILAAFGNETVSAGSMAWTAACPCRYGWCHRHAARRRPDRFAVAGSPALQSPASGAGQG